MTRVYELCFIVDPLQSDDEAQTRCDKYKELIADSGAQILLVDQPWGPKRKLAYPIKKFNEGRYFVIYVAADGQVPWPTVERLLMQDEHVLRHLLTRTDEGLRRALRRAKIKPHMPEEVAQIFADDIAEGDVVATDAAATDVAATDAGTATDVTDNAPA